MTGLGIRATVWKQSCRLPARASMSAYDMSFISLMSAPAAKTRSPPKRMTARMSCRAVASSAQALISSWTCALSAFIFGRSSRIVPTAPSTSSRTNSPTAASLWLCPHPSVGGVFRDSRGVVHTVSSADPLDDLPPDAARALQDALLRPVHGDLGTSLERCDAVRELVERWQDSFFAALPDDFDVEEERRWAVEAGMSLDDIEAEYAEEDSELDLTALGLDDDEDDLPVDLISADDDDDLAAVLPQELTSVLERELLLLPIRTRLEALVAAGDLVENWSDLLADEEKLLGHRVLRHGAGDLPHEHEALADRHAELHAAAGPRHES